MRKNFKRLAILLSILFYFVAYSFSQEITEENYLKLDKEIWTTFEIESSNLSDCFKIHPEKKDSLMNVYNQLKETADKKNRETAVKYASVPSGLKRLFWLRLDFSKDTLLSILKKLPPEMQKSNYGESLMQHINSNQIEEGNKYYDFKAIDSEGNKFRLSSLEGKNVLLLYGGLHCIRDDGRVFLKQLCKDTNPERFQIVVYWPCSSLEQLKELKTEFLVDYIFVSDFLEDHSLMKINYGAQATPTCFLIDKEGKVIEKSVGLPEEKLTKLKEEKQFE